MQFVENFVPPTLSVSQREAELHSQLCLLLILYILGPLTSGSVLVFYPFPHVAVLRMLICARQSKEINN